MQTVDATCLDVVRNHLDDIAKPRLNGIETRVQHLDSGPQLCVTLGELELLIRPSSQGSDRYDALSTQGEPLKSAEIVLIRFSAQQIAYMVSGWLIQRCPTCSLARIRGL